MHIRNILLKHFEETCPLTSQQWGFTRGKSTTGALLAATDQWFRFMEDGYDICAVFFDYRKAFDTVPHRLLLEKLHGYDVHPVILRWIENYLTMRSQYVCVSGASSDILPVASGVPQGSVLGPLLFIIYINDISEVPLSVGSMLLYADDSMLYRPIRTPDDYVQLQMDIDKLCVWTNDNLLQYNVGKCKHMIISRKKHPLLPNAPLTINNVPMEMVSEYKYLGVLNTSSLDWSKHVNLVCKKARQQVGILHRKFYGHCNSSTLKQLYLSYVRPHLEYVVPVWDPYQQGLVNALEGVQKFALRLCTTNWHAAYGELLSNCRLPTLAHRRRSLKLAFLYQVLHGNFVFPDVPLERRTLPFNLRTIQNTSILRPAVRTTSYQYSFFPHTILLWNSLPPSLHACSSIPHFKHEIAKLNL